MAAPGLGIGDIVKACAIIADYCRKYKDAPAEFDEVPQLLHYVTIYAD